MADMIPIDFKEAFGKIDWSWRTSGKVICYRFLDAYWRLKSYLSNKSFLLNVGNSFSQPASVFCGVRHNFTLEPLLFLICVNSISQADRCDLSLYDDDSCLVWQDKDICKIEKQLNDGFCKIWDWFVENTIWWG